MEDNVCNSANVSAYDDLMTGFDLLVTAADWQLTISEFSERTS